MGVLTTERSSPDDLKITFESNGVPFAVFLSGASIKAQTKEEIVKAMYDELACAIGCSQKASFALCMARCMRDGKCCDGGSSNCD